jgi:hypothetical protein
VVSGSLALVFATRLVRDALTPVAALAATALLALHPLLGLDASRGLREPTVQLLALPLLGRVVLGRGSALPEHRAAVLGSTAIALLLVRWELGLVALATFVVLAAVDGLHRTTAFAALAAALALAAPWLIANGRAYDDPLWHSNRNAVYQRNQEIIAGTLPGRQPPPEDPYAGDHITWKDYYLQIVGPAESARREVRGTGDNLAALLATIPIEAGPAPSRSTRAVAAMCTLGVGAMVILALRRRRRAVVMAAIVVIVGCAAYGTTSLFNDHRLVSFTLPALALLVGSGVSSIIGDDSSGEADGAPSVSTSNTASDV